MVSDLSQLNTIFDNHSDLSIPLKMSVKRTVPRQRKNNGVTIHNRFNKLQINVNKK